MKLKSNFFSFFLVTGDRERVGGGAGDQRGGET